MAGAGRVLFFGEPVTLAHVARPAVLAGAAAAAGYDVALATGAQYARLVAAPGVTVRNLWSIGSRRFLDAVAASRPVFSADDLERAIADDLAHIDAFRPDVVVGDFRLSLSTSARIAQVPYIAIANAYWSPCARPAWEIPLHPLSRLLGPAAATRLFRAARPFVFARHSLPAHVVRRRHGLPSLGFDLRRVFTESDRTLYADAPELVPVEETCDDHGARYIGPLHWSPDAPLPPGLAAPDARPLVYVTLGSSGDPALVERVIDALAPLDVRLAVATAGLVAMRALPPAAIVREYLPGAALAARAAFVVANGGSLTAQQALAHGTPLLGIPSNLDQLLNMGYMTRAGVALAVRPERADIETLRRACRRLLEEQSFRDAAARVRACYARYDAQAAFLEEVRSVLRKPNADGAGARREPAAAGTERAHE